MRSHINYIGWRGKRNISYKSMEISPGQMCFKTVRLTTIRNLPKQTISANRETNNYHHIRFCSGFRDLTSPTSIWLLVENIFVHQL